MSDSADPGLDAPAEKAAPATRWLPAPAVAMATVLLALLFGLGIFASRPEHPVSRVQHPVEIAILAGERDLELRLGIEREFRGSSGPGFLGIGAADWLEAARRNSAEILDSAAADLEAFADFAKDPENPARAEQSRLAAAKLRLRARAIEAFELDPDPVLPEDWNEDNPDVEFNLDGLGSALVNGARERAAGHSIEAGKIADWYGWHLGQLATRFSTRLGTLVPLGFGALAALAVLVFSGRKAWRVGSFDCAVHGVDRFHGWGVFCLYWVSFQLLSGLVVSISGSPLSGVSTALSSMPLIVLIFLGARARGCSPVDLVGFRVEAGRWPSAIGSALAGALLAGIGLVAWTLLTAPLVERDLWSNPILDYVVGAGPDSISAILVEAAIWAPLFEELAFRGVLFAGFRKRFAFLPAALGSSLLFGFSHGYDPIGQFAIVWVGFVLCWLFERTRSLLPCLMAHAVFNAVQIFFLSAFL